MKIKSLLRYSYRVIEFLFILSITAGIVSMGLSSHDSAEMIGMLMTNIGAMAWLWFISLPLLLIVFASFLRCSIPPLSIYKKVVLSLHLLNVVLWFVFYIILPKPEPCDAAMMEEHYKNHQDDMYDLVRYVRSSLDDSCSIVLQYRDNELQVLSIANNSERKTCTCIKNQEEFDMILHTAGLSMQEMTVIQEKMHKDQDRGTTIRNLDALKHRNMGNGLYETFHTDGKTVYNPELMAMPVGTDFSTIHRVERYRDWYADKNRVYYENRLLSEAKPQTFKVFPIHYVSKDYVSNNNKDFNYSYDANRVYYRDSLMLGVDVASFICGYDYVDSISFAFDKNRYYQGRPNPRLEKLRQGKCRVDSE